MQLGFRSLKEFQKIYGKLKLGVQGKLNIETKRNNSNVGKRGTLEFLNFGGIWVILLGEAVGAHPRETLGSKNRTAPLDI